MQWERVPNIHAFGAEWLADFVRASYRSSKCGREPGEAAIAAHRGLLTCGRIAPGNFGMLLAHMEPEASPRAQATPCFQQLLSLANTGIASPDELASLFRLLRPFTSANGRGARALWMWRAARGTAEEFAALRAFGQAPEGQRRSAI